MEKDRGVTETSECCCCHKTKERSEKEYKDLLNRLSRIEGQVRGIKGMVEKDAYCTDILVQVAAVNAALNSFNKVLLANHIKTCVTKDIKEGREETVDELVTVLQKLMKYLMDFMDGGREYGKYNCNCSYCSHCLFCSTQQYEAFQR